ncbi:MAG TPA: hypothetical protein VFS31_16820 [Chitinophagaceae bacterium]|jgi:hypothetical protein|nr:hypothetical protein [Chitinophagaceae bacterium]
MQKLNGREIYILVLLGLLTIILGFSAMRETTADFSSFRSASDGTLSMSKDELTYNAATIIQAIVTLCAFIFFLLKKRVGWMLAMPILIAATLSSMLAVLLSGIYLLFTLSALILLGVVFIFMPSTLRKFRINRVIIIGELLVMAALIAYYFYL